MRTHDHPEANAEMRAEVLQHIERYRMSTISAMRLLPAVRHPGCRLRNVVRELRRAGELGEAHLYGQYRYFYLAQPAPGKAAGRKRNSDQRPGPLSEQSKIHNYAILAFCCLGTHQRQRLTADELKQYFPNLHRPGLPLNYYVDTSGDLPRLGFLRVDSGGHGRWDRVAAKCRNDLDIHHLDVAFAPFIRAGQFEITLVTALPQKAARLQEEVSSWHDSRCRVIRIVAMPELAHLIAPVPGSRF